MLRLLAIGGRGELQGREDCCTRAREIVSLNILLQLSDVSFSLRIYRYQSWILGWICCQQTSTLRIALLFRGNLWADKGSNPSLSLYIPQQILKVSSPTSPGPISIGQ